MLIIKPTQRTKRFLGRHSKCSSEEHMVAERMNNGPTSIAEIEVAPPQLYLVLPHGI